MLSDMHVQECVLFSPEGDWTPYGMLCQLTNLCPHDLSWFTPPDKGTVQGNPFSTPSKEKKGAKRKRARSADLEPLEPDDAIESQFDEVP